MGTPRVTVEQIKAAMEATKGNVSASARVLGMARNNLYKRCVSSNIDPRSYRDNTPQGNGVTGAAHSVRVTGGRQGSSRAKVVHLSTAAPNAIYQKGSGRRSLADMSSAAAPTEEPKALRAARTVYFRPDHLRLLDDACLDLPAVLRERVSFSRVLEMLLDERGVDWLKEKLSAAHEPAEEQDR